MFIFFILSLCTSLQASYYSYDIDQAKKYESLNTPYEITWEEVTFWDKQYKEALKFKKEESAPFRLEAYLKNAENDFANLTQMKGSLAPLANKIITLFIPDYKANTSIKGLDDPYSNKVGDIIFEKYKNRFIEEGTLKPYVLNETEESWKGRVPYFGLTLGNMKPWIIEDVKSYRSQKPPESLSFWNLQGDEVLRERSKEGSKEKEAIVYWASPESDFTDRADAYMYEKNVPLKDRLKIRAELAAITSDATAAMFDSKYTYLIKRPHMVDAQIETVIPCPNHPSYPSGHSTISSMTATFLTHYFPENKHNWWRQANECGMSRVIGGLHYQADHVSGQDVGVRIAKSGLERLNK